eukprot:Skav210436  [mRNA]  locus=scaffold1297:58828:62709:+ [translate_table: standard]
MPPRKFKTDHRRGGGAGSKHISSFDEVKARNAGEESAYDKAPARARARRNIERGCKNADSMRANDKIKKGTMAREHRRPLKQANSQKARAARAGKAKEEEAQAARMNALNALFFMPRAKYWSHCGTDSKAARRAGEVTATEGATSTSQTQAARRRYEELHKASGDTGHRWSDIHRSPVKKRREEAAKKKAEEVPGQRIGWLPLRELRALLSSVALRLRSQRQKRMRERVQNLKDAMGKGDDKETKEAQIVTQFNGGRHWSPW